MWTINRLQDAATQESNGGIDRMIYVHHVGCGLYGCVNAHER